MVAQQKLWGAEIGFQALVNGIVRHVISTHHLPTIGHVIGQMEGVGEVSHKGPIGCNIGFLGKNGLMDGYQRLNIFFVGNGDGTAKVGVIDFFLLGGKMVVVGNGDGFYLICLGCPAGQSQGVNGGYD